MTDETRQPLALGLLDKVLVELRIRASEYGMTPAIWLRSASAWCLHSTRPRAQSSSS